jgi:DNA-binding IclR family transcriptional regulator
MGSTDESRRIKSLDRSLELVEAMRKRDSATISELEQETTLTAGTIHTHLSTLKSHGLVVQEDQSYRLGSYFITLGEHVRNSSDLYLAARSEVDKLASDTGEAAHLFVEDGGKGIPIYESFGPEAVGRKYHIRNREKPRQHLHCTAYGKAILSQLPRSRVEKILDRHGLESKSPETITDEEQLYDSLEQISGQGYAINDEEEIQGIRGIGTAIVDNDSEVRGAISLSAPTTRMGTGRLTEELPSKLLEAANVIQINLSTDNYEY